MNVAESRVPLSRSSRPKSRKRWWIAWTLFFSTATNYISRQSFSVLAPVISTQYHINHTGLAKIFGSFQVAYALTWLVGGMVLDKVGCRIGLGVAVVWWSIMNMLTGLATSVTGFAFFRFMLGIGEGFNWPGASKVVAEWFPRDERGLAVGIFDSGSSVGAAISTLVIPVIAMAVGWRWAFVAAGLVGFLWLAVWLRIYQPPERDPDISIEELTLLRQETEREAVSSASAIERWRGLMKDRNLWGIVLGRALTDPIWWFYVFWLPQYLSDARGFSLQRLAAFGWLPFVAADLGNLTGGWIAGFCIRRGMSVLRTRTWICLCSCLPTMAGIPAVRVHSAYSALALICLALWGHASWSTMGLTLPSDLFPQRVVGFVTGLSGLAAGIFGALFTLAVGVLVDRFSYQPAFVLAGLLPVVATVWLFVLLRAPDESIHGM